MGLDLSLQLRRVILFTSNLAAMTVFYRDVLVLTVLGREEGWVEFGAGGCSVALHAGNSKVGHRPPKLALYASDVAATRSALVERGLTQAGPVKFMGRFELCDGKDPDGNPFLISSRM